MSFWAAMIAIVAPFAPLHAQLRADSAGRDARRMMGDMWSIWTAPVHARASDAEGLVAVAGVVGVAGILDEPVQRWIHDHADSWAVGVLHPLRESARYPSYELGSGQYLLPISAALYIAGAVSKSSGLRDAGLGCATAHLTSAGARDIVYLLVARDRPRLSPDDAFHVTMPGSRDWNRHSFFSGHTANSMGCASFLAHRFKLHVAEPFIYGYVMAIGAGRMLDGRHWLSDTIVGGLFGYVVGRTISGRMVARERSSTSAPPPLAITFSFPVD
jgi:membrane-associated phospholipid phosphatase